MTALLHTKIRRRRVLSSWAAPRIFPGVLLVACGGASGVPERDVLGDGRAAPAAPSTAAPATGMEVLYTGEGEPYLLALDDQYLYWASPDTLRRAPLAGGEAPVTLATGTYIRRILVHGEYVYFSDSAANTGRISRVAREGGEPEWIADATDPRGMEISQGVLYWAEPGNSVRTGSLLRAELDGTDARALATGLASPGDLAVDNEAIYFTSTGEFCSVSSEGGAECVGGGILRLPIAGGVPERVHATSGTGAIVLNERGLYWSADSPPRVMHAPLGGSERELADVLVEGTGDLSSDAAALYWAANDRVLRLSFEERRLERLVTELEGARAVTVRGDWAYVAESATGRILRVATDGSANRPSGPITGPCPAPIGTAEELALTPRADQNLELFALSLEPGRLTASSSTYDRVVADISALRGLAPELGAIGYFAEHDGKTLSLGLTDIAAQSLRAGEYSAWDCLNDAYGVTALTPREIFGATHVSIELRGIYDTNRIAELYAQLPGIEWANADLRVGDGPTLCAARAGERYEYVVDRAGGDCPAGCTEHEAHRFLSEAPGQVTALDTWSSQSEEPAPEWFGRICN